MADIFGSGEVRRSVYAYSGTTRPGNSGGALVDVRGRVLGIVFASALGHADQGFAVTSDEVQSDLLLLNEGRPPLDPRRGTCAE